MTNLFKIIYRIFIFYPYYLTYNLIILIKRFILTVFFNQVNISKIDEMTGIEFEYFVYDLLNILGYTDISLSKSSGDYGIDVFASKNNLTYGFQCKRYRKRIGVEAVQQVSSGVNYYDLDIPVVITNSYFSEAAINLANNIDVNLINRDKLIKMIQKANLFYKRIPLRYHLTVLLISSLLIYLYLIDLLPIPPIVISLFLNGYMIFKDIYYSRKKISHTDKIQIHEN